MCDGVRRPVPVSGRFRASSAPACNGAVSRGMGVGLAFSWQVGPMVNQGRVELILSEFEPPPTPLSAIWPASAGLPARTRLLIDFLAARFSSERW